MSKKEKQIYCGIDKLKENQKRGTSRDCAEIKQIRYFGLNKVPKSVADEFKGIPVESALKEKRLAKFIGKYRALIENYKDDIRAYKDDDDYKKNKTYQKTVADLEKKLKDAREKLLKYGNKMKEFRAKKTSKK